MTISNALRDNLDNSMRAAQDVSLGTRLAGRGVYTVLAADDTAGTVDIDSGFTGAEGFFVQVYRAGVLIPQDINASISAGVLTVADGTTFALTTGDEVHWMVY